MKTATIKLESIKDSDGWFSLCSDLGLIKYSEDDEGETNNDIVYKMFEYGEYADMEIVVDENFNIVGGRIIPTGKR